MVIRITLGNRVLIEGEKLQLKQEGEGPPKKVGGAEGGDDGHLAVGEAEGAEQKERASSKAEEKKEKSGDKGGKGKGGGKGGAKGQGGGAAAATVRVWEVKHEVCLTFGKSSSNVLSDMVMYPLLSKSPNPCDFLLAICNYTQTCTYSNTTTVQIRKTLDV